MRRFKKASALLQHYIFSILIKYREIDGRVRSYCIFGLVDGSLLFIIININFCGIIKKKIWKLKTLTFNASLIAIIHTLLAIINFVMAYDLSDKKTKLAFAKIFDSYDQKYKHKQHVDIIQNELKCCGLDGPQSWTLKIPNSCCEHSPCNNHTAFKRSCSKSLDNKYKTFKSVCGILNAGIAVVAYTLAALALCVVRKAVKQRRKARQDLN
ncbi:uncharacterized protein LOC123014122 isoform X2 [Tribolium madens]|uniref:uncharacterized protein LOC123014122 isoform X2 n=1 Tax=Tribolium madens TaxID=41895 RepID=UPI001CF7295A|nr:uncharacterized protein LOC123014122 isoform X2 [Tribolium madens]